MRTRHADRRLLHSATGLGVVLAMLLGSPGAIAAPVEPAAAPSSAAAPATTSGDALPVLEADLQATGALAYADSEVVVIRAAPTDEVRGPAWDVRRRDDGTLLRQVVIGSDALTFADGAVFRNGAGAVRAEGLGDGHVLWTVPLEANDQVLDARRGGLVVRTGIPVSDGTVVLLGPDGDRRTVMDATTGAPIAAERNRVVYRDTDALFLAATSFGSLRRVTLADATATIVLPGADFGPSAVLGDRLYWVATAELRWATTDGRSTGSVPFAGTDPYFPSWSWPDALHAVGDTLYAFRGSPATVRPLTVAAEAVLGDDLPIHPEGRPVLGSDAYVYVATNGTSGQVVATKDFSSGSAAFELPAKPASVTVLAISDDLVVADVTQPAGYSERSDASLWQHRRAADDAWDPVRPGVGVQDGELVDAAGETVLLRDAVDADGRRGPMVVWPGGSRRLSHTPTGLGHGGDQVLVLRSTPTGGYETVVEDARSGRQLAVVPEDSAAALDSSVLWTLAPRSGTAESLDLRTGGRSTTTIGAACAQPPGLDARGRWLLVRCGDDVRVVDSLGVYAPQGVPASEDLALGDGFVVSSVRAAGGGPRVVTVTALDGSGVSRDVGPMHSLYSPPEPVVDVDDSGRTIAFLDTTRQVRTATPDWVPEPATTIETDSAAPRVHTLTTGPATAPTGTLTVRWTADDLGTQPFAPTGVASSDVELRRTAPGGTSYGSWDRVATATGGTSWTVSAAPGVSVCVRVRARDVRGNVGDWSSTACSRVDGAAPTFDRVPSVPARTKATSGKASLDVRLHARDDVATTTYDLRYRVTQPGRSTAAWTYPAALQGTAKTSATLTVGIGTVCVSARARDAAGNTSAWTGPRCGDVDGTAPRITAAAATPRAGEFEGSVGFSWRGSDDDAVASYDVQVRRASANGALGSWAWAQDGRVTTRTSLRFKVALPAGGQACFRVRAHDLVGNTSSWSKESCAYRERFASGSVTTSHGARVTWDAAHLRRVVELPRSGARATARTAIAGRGVSVVALTGPRAGTVGVYAGTTKIGTVRLKASSKHWERFIVTAPRGFTGKVSFRSSSAGASQLRSWTVIR
ncbi:hypothetical protein [Isoptericola sp. NPDC057653]|uniref:hypothetical protein n=1 Tax=Isoptericola sp. NPDC057653 TaxID=3346195 RepID=UPI0036C432EE